MYRRITLLFIGFLLIPHLTQAATLSSQLTTLFKQQKLVSSKQAVCIQAPSGTIVSKNTTMRITPASVSKVYLSDWALSTLPIDFRYTTDFYLQGKTLYINGGGDPHFVVQHLRAVLNKIHDDQGVTVNRIVFSPTFFYNWKLTPQEVQTTLTQSLADEQKQNPTIPTSSNIIVESASDTYSGNGIHYQFQSMPLPNLLKQINDYSTNVSANTLFEKLGGSSAFTAYMKKTYGVGTSTIRFETGSGLTGNYTTCNVTLRVLKHLDQQIQKKGLALTDILTVPTLDPGVLQKRTIDPDDALAMVAKSGTINNHLSLAGVIKTKKGSEYFAIFTDFPNLSKTLSVKTMIDTFIGSVLKSQRSTLEPFDYTPNPDAFTNYKIMQK